MGTVAEDRIEPLCNHSQNHIASWSDRGSAMSDTLQRGEASRGRRGKRRGSKRGKQKGGKVGKEGSRVLGDQGLRLDTHVETHKLNTSYLTTRTPRPDTHILQQGPAQLY